MKADMFYTGIGSRDTPENILTLMEDIGQVMADDGFILRSGGANGADSAFERGCDEVNGKKEIYLPWKGFNENNSPHYKIPAAAYTVAEEVYGARWKYLSQPIRDLMARNMPQVSGMTLDIVSTLVVCWTPDGCTTKKSRTKYTGGTGQAIAYADILSAPVFNLKNEKDFERLLKYIETIGVMKW